MSVVRSCPARPTNGIPCRSSSAPGPSPTKTRSAWRVPPPHTAWGRGSATRPLGQQPAAGGTSAATDAVRGAGGWGVGGGVGGGRGMGAGQNGPGGAVEGAEGVYHREGPVRGVTDGEARRAQAAGDGVVGAPPFADGGAGAGPDPAGREGRS